MKIVYDIKKGDYIESEKGEKVQLYVPWDEKAIVKAWEFGMEETWEVMRQICAGIENGSMDIKSIKIFDGLSLFDVFRLYTAKEGVKKVKDYEEKQNRKEEGNKTRKYLKRTVEKRNEEYKELIKAALTQTFEELNKNKSEGEKKMNNNKKEFLRIVVTGTKEHPYYTIDYIENGEEHNGYGSYNLGYVLKWKEDMEIYNAQIEEKNKSEGENKMKTGDKFIIDLGEKIKQYYETPDGKRNLIDTVYRIEGTNAAITEGDLQNLEEYKKKPTIPREEIEKEGYEKGLNELWEALKQVNKMRLKDYEECTGERFKYDLYSKITPMEFVEKFKEWKEKQENEEIKVGDEIESSEQIEKAVVLWIEVDGYWGCLQNNLFFTVKDKQKKYWKKTGKHYDEVEKLFQKLKESKGEIPFL